MTLDQLRQWLQSTAFLAADNLNVWRDTAITGLAFFIIGCLWLWASLMGFGD